MNENISDETIKLLVGSEGEWWHGRGKGFSGRFQNRLVWRQHADARSLENDEARTVKSTSGQGLSKQEFYRSGNKANHEQKTSHRIKTLLRSGYS